MLDRFLRCAALGSLAMVWLLSVLLVAGGCIKTPAPTPRAPLSPTPAPILPKSCSLLCFSEPWCGDLPFPEELRSYQRERSQYIEACRAAKSKQNALAVKYAGRMELVEISKDEKPAAETQTIVYNSIWSRKVNGSAAASYYRQYGISSIPAYVLLDEHGREAGRWVGGDSFKEIESAVESALR